jgi:hypothetical protein
MNCKNQSLANVTGIRQRPVAVAGFRRERLIRSGQNGRIRSYPAGSWPNLGRFGQILPEPAGFRPEFGPPVTRFQCRQNTGDRIPAPAGYQQSDVVGLRRRLDSDDRQLLNSDDRISNVRVRTKSLISENDLRF